MEGRDSVFTEQHHPSPLSSPPLLLPKDLFVKTVGMVSERNILNRKGSLISHPRNLDLDDCVCRKVTNSE